eukprot:69326_1
MSTNSCDLKHIKQKVKQLIDNKQYTDALILLSQIKNPSYKIENKIASIYETLHDYKTAELYYKNSINIESNPTTFHKLAMLYHYQLKDKKNAEINYLKCIEMDPNNIFYKHNLAKLYLELNDYQNSKYYFKQCLNIDQSKASTHYYYSVLCCKTNKIYKAFFHIQKAIELQPQIALYHFQNALIHITLKEIKNADNAFQTAIKLSNGKDKYVSEYKQFINANKSREGLQSETLCVDEKQMDSSSLPILNDKSKYKCIAIEYSQKMNWSMPLEICYDNPKFNGLNIEERYFASVTFGEIKQSAIGSTKKKALYNVYCNLVSMVIPEKELIEMILQKKPNYIKKSKIITENVHPKSKLIHYAHMHNVAPPLTVFDGICVSDNIVKWKAKVSFCGESVEAVDVKKKAAEAKCCVELLNKLKIESNDRLH